MKLASVSRMAEAIVDAHRAKLWLPESDQSSPTYSQDESVYVAAKQASRTLGFIDIDAECIAKAWQARTQRLGEFNATAWPDAAEDFGLDPHSRPHAFAPCPKSLGLYAVLPSAAWVGRMARAGVPTLQLRFKSEDDQAIADEVSAAIEAVRCTRALLFINDHWQAALQAGAYGVHLGQEDIDSADLDAIRSAGLRLGLSTHGYAEMLRADRLNPSYVALGAVYPTTLKAMPTAPQGPGRLSVYARLLCHRPLVAIGGINESRLPEVLKSDVGSVAVVRALLGAQDPEATAAQWMSQISSAKTRRSQAEIQAQLGN